MLNNLIFTNSYRIVESDNYGGDYPDEQFVNLPPMSEQDAERLCDLINTILRGDDTYPRYWKVVDGDTYRLSPGFEP
jgi:hypothetical protein